MNILVTGGAGYVGTTLIPQLLKLGHRVRVLDNLMFGGVPLLPFFRSKNFEFQKGDIRDPATVQEAVRGQEAIVHLAAIVGYPACRLNPQMAKEVNIDGVKNAVAALSNNQFIIQASTGSSYGHIREEVTEKTPLNPLSLYGQTKSEAEKIIQQHPRSIIYRFMTAFGVSPRMRLNLMINDFTYKAVTEQYLVIYEKHHKRAFIHVHDMARAICFALAHLDQMTGEIYNVGSKSLGLSKEDICETIKKHTNAYVHYAEVGTDADQRNYEANFDKIQNLGFATTVGIEEGVQELIAAYRAIQYVKPYSNA